MVQLQYDKILNEGTSELRKYVRIHVRIHIIHSTIIVLTRDGHDEREGWLNFLSYQTIPAEEYSRLIRIVCFDSSLKFGFLRKILALNN